MNEPLDSGPVAEAAASRRASAASGREMAEFHDELRTRTLPILFWSACVYNTVYVAWCGFDYLLEPQHFRYFLTLRLIAASINTALVVAVHRRRLQRYTWEAFWLWLFTKGVFIALMLRVVEEANYMAYVVGFTLVIYAAALLPYWAPRWAMSITCVLLALSMARLARPGSGLVGREVIASAFILLSSAGLALIMAYFKYSLARSDFLTRRASGDLARRERDARVELDRAGSALRAALDQLKALDRLKSQFFANISHELRTPLTLILTPLENMRLQLTGAQHKTLDVVRRNAERLLRLIDDLLELSRLDAGGLRLTLSEIDLRALTSTVFENALATANSRGIRFELKADAQVQRVWGDAHRLEIVLTNLVSNAIKYTPSGGAVQVMVHHLAEGAQIDVSDTGPGISEEDLPHVFERFFQVLRTDRRRSPGGVGIGLALAKELVELHGGRLWVCSTLQKGSVFSVLLPYGRAHVRPEVIERRQPRRAEARSAGVLETRPPDAAPAHGPAELDAQRTSSRPPQAKPMLMRGRRRARLVLAEDQEELREFIAELLKPDYDVTSAEHGARAWQLVQELRPDLVISDVMMPELSGTQLCGLIKRDARLCNTPVILLTARVGAEATLEGYAQGADDFVGKPFHPQVLLARVRAQLLLRNLALDLAEREKLAAVGTLSAGILHEVRNPVNAILNAARVLAQGPVDPDTARRLLAVVSDCAGRIHQLTESLDQHARPADGGASAPSDVAKGMDATLALLGHRLRDVEVRREYGKRNVTRAPAGPVNQIFLNLLDNALNAGARRLEIRIADAKLGQLEVSIEDDGPGIPGELRERIFDAFVSGGTKGSGLGLYLSRCIAEQYGCQLELSDAPRTRGALFKVSLPTGEMQ